MNLNDEEYLSLFKKIQNQKSVRVNDQLIDAPMLKETPNYDNFNNNNEIYRNNYSQDLNLNEFNIETRINGQNINEIRRQEKEDKLNEIMEHRRQMRLNEIKKTQDTENLNEKVNWNADVITLDIFNKARYNSMMQIVKTLPK